MKSVGLEIRDFKEEDEEYDQAPKVQYGLLPLLVPSNIDITNPVCSETNKMSECTIYA